MSASNGTTAGAILQETCPDKVPNVLNILLFRFPCANIVWVCNLQDSADILAAWEKSNKNSCVAPSVRRAELETLFKLCGLSPSGLNVQQLRILLLSLRKTKLSTNNEQKVKSDQQRARRLLFFLDPSLQELIQTKTKPMETGDYVWSTSKMPGLVGAIDN